jgi:integrase
VSVRKHKDKWIIEIYNGQQRIRRSVGTRKDALRIEQEIRTEIESQAVPAIGIEKALENYLLGEAQSLKSFESLKSKARAIRPYIRKKTFDQIGEVADSIKRDMTHLKPATVNRRLALLRRLGNYAYDLGWIEQPVGRRVKLLAGESERHYYLTTKQVELIASKCPTTGDLIRLAAFTGMRRGEIFKLTPTDIQEDFIYAESKTRTGKPRAIPIPDQIRPILRTLHFPLDKALDWELRKEFEAARDALGLSHIRFHDLRHTYASLLAQAGATLKLIGEAMGHSSTQMTNRYAHLVAEHLTELATKLSKL